MALGTRHGSAEESTGLLLWQVTNRWQQAQRAALKPFDLTHVQFVLLASLAYLNDDGAVSQRRLAEHAVTDPMMTSQVVRGLEGRGLVERSADPKDARARAVTVTRDGARLANAALVAVEDCDASFFAVVGDQAAFNATLRTLRQASG